MMVSFISLSVSIINPRHQTAILRVHVLKLFLSILISNNASTFTVFLSTIRLAASTIVSVSSDNKSCKSVTSPYCPFSKYSSPLLFFTKTDKMANSFSDGGSLPQDHATIQSNINVLIPSEYSFGIVLVKNLLTTA